MERRLLTFIVVSTMFFFFYHSLKVMFGPPPKPAAQKNADDQDNAPEADPGAPAVDQADRAGPDQAGPDQTGQDQAGPDGAAEEPRPELPQVQRPPKQQWMTLGSMNPTAGYYMLITLTNLGGGVERIELTERDQDNKLKYRRVDVRHGYLGYLAGETSTLVDGVTVNVVGPGTPADLAGIQVGDIIVAAAGEVITSREDMNQALINTKPGDIVTIEVLRSGAQANAKQNDQELPPVAAPRGPPIALKAKLSQHPLDLVRLARDGGDDQIAGNLSRLSCLMTLGKINRKSIPTGKRSLAGVADPMELLWSTENIETPDQGTHRVRFHTDLSDQDLVEVGGKSVRLARSYRLAPASYVVDLGVSVQNSSNQPQNLAYRLEGANGITLEGWWYSNKISPNFGGAAARDIIYRTAADGHSLISGYELLKRAKKDPKAPQQTIFAPDGEEDSRNLRYIGVDAQYFTVAYLPPEQGESLTTFRRAAAGVVADAKKVKRHKERAVNSSFLLDSVAVELQPGQALRQELRLFAGPKQPELLEKYGLGDCIYYGWFSWFAKILASLLHLLSAVGNYALAIIILTVIVRGCMFPLSRKAAVNAQRMQELAPEFKKIAEQYKDDMEGRFRAQRELQKRVGFNPMAGCLP
ncbi:MAG: YidC/Oxa1 family insertase periplasmic-domain containing protein, partial [Pirellulales bacterium]|nr:YidC/Oxa1 family insertase periplasmic-domain containing protein [Pirellulales bacterium]